VRFGAVISGNNSLFSNNEIDHFGDDGIDYAASNISITHNTIHDNFDLGDGNHEDAMQGQNGALATGVLYNSFSNILIDSNLVIRQDGPEARVRDLSARDRCFRRGLDECHRDQQCHHHQFLLGHLLCEPP
jgi:hypothetical protein